MKATTAHMRVSGTFKTQINLYLKEVENFFVLKLLPQQTVPHP